MSDQKRLWTIVFLLISTMMGFRVFFAQFLSIETVAALVITMPFTYWFVAPFIAGQKMEMPSWGFSLEPGRVWPLRASLFSLGALLLIAGAVV